MFTWQAKHNGVQRGLDYPLPWIRHCGQDLCAVLHPRPVSVLPLGARAGMRRGVVPGTAVPAASGGGLSSSKLFMADFCQQPRNQGVCWKRADHILWDLCCCALTRAASLLLPLLTSCQNVHSKEETGESSFLRNLSVLFLCRCHCISVVFKLSLPGITVSDGTSEVSTAWHR